MAAADLLERRREQGLVRHCHGDLHLANLVLLDGRPTLFDCIEFDDEIACIDVLYDLAFLVMDLIEKGHRPEACSLLNGWLERTGDLAGLALLPLFLSLRAVIRAKVLGLAVIRGADAAPADARRYLALGRALLAPSAPLLVAIGGGSGTGKTTLARHLAPEFGPQPGAVILRSDVIRKGLFGREPTDRLPPEAYAPGRLRPGVRCHRRACRSLRRSRPRGDCRCGLWQSRAESPDRWGGGRGRGPVPRASGFTRRLRPAWSG